MKPLSPSPTDLQLTDRALPMLGREDWDGLTALVAALPAESAYTAVRLIGEHVPLHSEFRGHRRNGSALALTIAGGVLMGKAGRIRGAGHAEDVSDAQWEAYIPTLAEAQALLAEANALDPGIGLAAAWRATASIDGDEEQKDAAEAAVRAARDVPVSGFVGLLSARAKKWGGSHKAMWRVAEEYAEADAPGTLGLIARAHWEQVLYGFAFEEDPELQTDETRYFARSDVMEEIAALSQRVLSERGHHDPRNILFADNWFAFILTMAKKSRLARPHLQAIGKHYDRRTWLFYGDPHLSYVGARVRALLLPV